MKCPHCLENFYEAWRAPDQEGQGVVRDCDGWWVLQFCKCPACKRAIIRLSHGEGENVSPSAIVSTQLVRPKGMVRAPLSPEVPIHLAQDYVEACLVLSDSPKASAALSRRCLQRLLKEQANTKKGNLAAQIQEVVDLKALPGYLASGLAAIASIGDFATSPVKSTNTGEIAEVKPGEADWNLDILESLFDFYFVQPSRLRERAEALTRKLQDGGKPATDGEKN